MFVADDRYIKQKAVIAGNIIHHYWYDRLIPIGQKQQKTTKTNNKNIMTSEEKQIQNENKTKQKIKYLIQSNVGAFPRPTSFITLTFRDNIQELTQAHKFFTIFRKRFSRYLVREHDLVLYYIAVPEYQKRGAVHYHMLVFNCPFIPLGVLDNLWEWGYTNLRKVDDPDLAVQYLIKYLGEEKRKQKHKRMFYKSDNLLRPKTEINYAVEAYQFDGYEKTFQSQWGNPFSTGVYTQLRQI